MMKRKVLILSLVLAALMLLAGFATAETSDPIVTSVEVSPSKLTGPGPVNVTITISNAGNTDLTDPVVLYDPAAQIVSDFGVNGAALLKAGESKTWTGTYDVNQRTLDNGSILYYVKYTLYGEGGKAVNKSQAIRATISLQTAETDIDVKRTISPTIARNGQEVVVRYEITNSGTVNLLDVTIQEHRDIHNKKQTIPVLKPGQTAEIKYPVTMGKKDLTSSATITYKSETQPKTQTYKVEKQTITYGEPALEAKLTSSAKGVVQNGTVTLTLELKNTGSVDYTDIRVTDAKLGDVFTSQEVKAGKTLTLTKEITVAETMEYVFTVTGSDATGAETSIVTDALTVTAVDPSDALKLTVVATPDRTEVFEQPGHVRFTIAVTNDSRVDAKNVKISHGDTTLYTFSSIAAGQTRTLSRDTALSMAGKYGFTVTAQDPLDSTLTFESNEMQIAFSVPTPAPATPTPAPDPTPEPTYAAATIAPITARSIGTVPKFIQSILLPVLIAAGVVLVASCALLIVASVRRAQQKKASEAAIDQLERAPRRDYVTPSDEEPEQPSAQPEQVRVESNALDVEEEAYELPHMKYARSAVQTEQPVEDNEAYNAVNGTYYDDTVNSYDMPQQPADGAPYGGYGYDDYYADEPQGDEGWKQEPAQPAEEPAKRGLFGKKKKDKAAKGKNKAAEVPQPQYPQSYDEGYGDGYDDGYGQGGYAGEYDISYDQPYPAQDESEPQPEQQASYRRSRRSRSDTYHA